MTDTVLPPCPTCASEYVYEMDALLVCPECAHEWSRDEASTADDACPFTTLYWDCLDRHRDEFVKNHRMSQQVYGLNRLSDLPDLRVRAREVLTGLDAGLI